MEGDPESLAMASRMPLDESGMSRVRWLRDDNGTGMSLHYSDDSASDMVIVRGPLQAGSFAYLDHAGEWHDEWKPAPDDDERLPRLVRFEAETTRGRLYWLVPLLTDPIPQDRMRPDRMVGHGLDQKGAIGRAHV